MSRMSEMLAEQLRAPGFREVERGYDQEAVRDHLTVAHGLITRLERDVEEFTTRARAAEAAAVRAEAQADVPAPEDDELLRTVFDGQRRADDLVAAAEAEAARIRHEADARIAALQDDSEVVRLRARLAERAEAVARLDEAITTANDDLRAVTEAADACRRVMADRLAPALRDLREPAMASMTPSGNTERT